MKNNNKLNIYKTILKILLLAVLIVIGLIIAKYTGYQIVEKENVKIVEVFDSTENKVNEQGISQIEMKGYKVIGKIKISKINLEYPILEKTSEESMKISISRFSGEGVNLLGNLSLAGHNNRDGTMFGRNKKLSVGDIIELTDLTNTTISYEIYKFFSTDPNDVTILQSEDENVREVTLITCTKGHEKRLIIKAKEI